MLTFKNILILLIIILIAGWCIIYNKEKSVRNFDSTGTTVIAFGDSLVRGVGSTENNDFISLLSQRTSTPIINLGISGNTTANGLDRIDATLTYDPKIVILLLGGNDYLRKVPMEETFENLRKIVDKIHDQGSMVLLLGVRGGVLKDIYEEKFKEFAKENHVAFVPNVLDGLIGNDEYMFDGIHPNDAGYRKIADKVEPVLRDLLEI